MLVKPVKTDGNSFSENTRNSHRRYFNTHSILSNQTTMFDCKYSYFFNKTNSTSTIFVCGFLLTTSTRRFFTRPVFHKKPKNRLYWTDSATNIESRLVNVPLNSSSVNIPSKLYHASPQWSAVAGVTMESRTSTTVSLGTARNSMMVWACVVLTAAKSLLRPFNCLINAASSARNLSYSFTVSSSDCTRAAFSESRTRYVSTSVSNVSVLFRYLSLSPLNCLIFARCAAHSKRIATNIAAIPISNLVLTLMATLMVLHPCQSSCTPIRLRFCHRKQSRN